MFLSKQRRKKARPGRPGRARRHWHAFQKPKGPIQVFDSVCADGYTLFTCEFPIALSLVAHAQTEGRDDLEVFAVVIKADMVVIEEQSDETGGGFP